MLSFEWGLAPLRRLILWLTPSLFRKPLEWLARLFVRSPFAKALAFLLIYAVCSALIFLAGKALIPDASQQILASVAGMLGGVEALWLFHLPLAVWGRSQNAQVRLHDSLHQLLARLYKKIPDELCCAQPGPDPAAVIRQVREEIAQARKSRTTLVILCPYAVHLSADVILERCKIENEEVQRCLQQMSSEAKAFREALVSYEHGVHLLTPDFESHLVREEENAFWKSLRASQTQAGWSDLEAPLRESCVETLQGITAARRRKGTPACRTKIRRLVLWLTRWRKSATATRSLVEVGAPAPGPTFLHPVRVLPRVRVIRIGDLAYLQDLPEGKLGFMGNTKKLTAAHVLFEPLCLTLDLLAGINAGRPPSNRKAR